MFLCSETAVLTLAAVVTFQEGHGKFYLDDFYHPIRARIVVSVFALSEFILLLVSPFFFRRLGALAVAYWVTALAALAWASMPVF